MLSADVQERECAYLFCSNMFTSSKTIRIYCSAKCNKRAFRHRNGAKPSLARPCANPDCCLDISHKNADARYCSNKCFTTCVTSEQKRAWYLSRTYGITLDDYQRMVMEQGGACSICERTDPICRYGLWHIDHCHTTGAVRGLLCMMCNVGIGQFQDDPARVRSAIEYVKRGKMELESHHSPTLRQERSVLRVNDIPAVGVTE